MALATVEGGSKKKPVVTPEAAASLDQRMSNMTLYGPGEQTVYDAATDTVQSKTNGQVVASDAGTKAFGAADLNKIIGKPKASVMPALQAEAQAGMDLQFSNVIGDAQAKGNWSEDSAVFWDPSTLTAVNGALDDAPPGSFPLAERDNFGGLYPPGGKASPDYTRWYPPALQALYKAQANPSPEAMASLDQRMSNMTLYGKGEQTVYDSYDDAVRSFLDGRVTNNDYDPPMPPSKSWTGLSGKVDPSAQMHGPAYPGITATNYPGVENYQNWVANAPYYTDDARSLFAGLPFVGGDPSVPGGAGYYPMQDYYPGGAVMANRITDESMVHELGHAWWDQRLRPNGGDAGFIMALERLAQENNPEFAWPAYLARQYLDMQAQNADKGWDGGEWHGSLWSGVMGNIYQLPEYMWPYYSGMFDMGIQPEGTTYKTGSGYEGAPLIQGPMTPGSPTSRVPLPRPKVPIPLPPGSRPAPVGASIASQMKRKYDGGMTNDRLLMTGDAPHPNPSAGGALPEAIWNPTGAPLGILSHEETQQAGLLPRYNEGTGMDSMLDTYFGNPTPDVGTSYSPWNGYLGQGEQESGGIWNGSWGNWGGASGWGGIPWGGSGGSGGNTGGSSGNGGSGGQNGGTGWQGSGNQPPPWVGLQGDDQPYNQEFWRKSLDERNYILDELARITGLTRESIETDAWNRRPGGNALAGLFYGSYR